MCAPVLALSVCACPFVFTVSLAEDCWAGVCGHVPSLPGCGRTGCPAAACSAPWGPHVCCEEEGGVGGWQALKRTPVLLKRVPKL